MPGLVKTNCSEKCLSFERAYKCAVHKRCLPVFTPSSKLLVKWLEREESSLYKLCEWCEDFSG